MTTAKGEEAKTRGNEAFKAGRYEAALASYLEAIKEDSTCATYFANAAACYTRMANYQMAIEMANEALSRDPSQIKAYYRRGVNRMHIGELRMALADLRTAARAAPGDQDVRRQLGECEKMAMREAFAKAIRASTFALTEDSVEAMEVDAGYDGVEVPPQGIGVDTVLQLQEQFKQGGRLPIKHACRILLQAKRAFSAEPTLVRVSSRFASLTVCGDTHGQFMDLMKIFSVNRMPSADNAYLFNGDFVDRGQMSVEVFLTLCAWKAALPGAFFLCRGNHESESVNRFHGFWDELGRKFPSSRQADMHAVMNATMNCIPLAAVLYDRYFVVHGGIPRADLSLADIEAIDRFSVPAAGSLMSQLLWSDPQPENGIKPSHRGEGVLFGPDVTAAFLRANALKAVIRSHVWEPAGYKVEHGGQCVTIFSAPNYIPGTPSPAAYISVPASDADELSFHQFTSDVSK